MTCTIGGMIFGLISPAILRTQCTTASTINGNSMYDNDNDNDNDSKLYLLCSDGINS